MARSHPPALIKVAARSLRDECGVARGQRVLVAVSGGGDSQALLHVMCVLAPRLGLTVCAHGVDHGLRSEAGTELDLAEELAASFDVPFSRTRLRLPPGPGTMQRARDSRWRALDAARKRAGADFIATAHHADDRAETVLLRLLRGAGPRGLSVLPARAGQRIRPLIRARRSDVLAHLARHAVSFASDPSNEDRRFLRVRVRLEVLPLLEDLSPQIVSHLNALADQLAQGPPPRILGPDGEAFALGRAQIGAIQRLLAAGSRRGRVRLPGGQEARLDARGEIVVEIGAGSGRRGSGAARRRKSD